MAGTSGRFPARARVWQLAAAAARPTEVACRLPTVASCKVRRSGGRRARGTEYGVGKGGGHTQLWRPGFARVQEYMRKVPTVPTAPFPKRGWVSFRSCSCSSPRAPVLFSFILSCAGFEASEALAVPLASCGQQGPLGCFWAAKPAFGPTQSDEGGCQHHGSSWLGSLFLVPSPVSSRTHGICCTPFSFSPCALPVSYVTHRIMSRMSLSRGKNHLLLPQYCPAG